MRNGRAGIGMVLRDSNGAVIFSPCSVLQNCSSPLESELMACRDGLAEARHRTERNVLVEVDCANVIRMNEKEVVHR